MDPLMISLRILHIAFGVFWLGSAALWLLFLRPQLRRLGPAIERPAEAALDKVTGPAFGMSSLGVIGTGAAQALIMRKNTLDTFLSDGWGWAILIGFVATLVAAIIGFAVELPTGLRTEKLMRSIQGGAPNRDKLEQELERLYRRRNVTNWTAFALLLIAMGAMSAARYV